MEATRTRKPICKLGEIHYAIADAARKQFEAEGRVTTDRLMAAAGLARNPLHDRLKALKYHGLFPWKIARVPPPQGQRYYGGAEDRSDSAAMLPLWRENATKEHAEAVKGMVDARSEIDDPLEHGPLTAPRSLPRAKVGDEMHLWISEARRIARRLGIGRKAVAA